MVSPGGRACERDVEAKVRDTGATPGVVNPGSISLALARVGTGQAFEQQLQHSWLKYMLLNSS